MFHPTRAKHHRWSREELRTALPFLVCCRQRNPQTVHRETRRDSAHPLSRRQFAARVHPCAVVVEPRLYHYRLPQPIVSHRAISPYESEIPTEEFRFEIVATMRPSLGEVK